MLDELTKSYKQNEELLYQILSLDRILEPEDPHENAINITEIR